MEENFSRLYEAVNSGNSLFPPEEYHHILQNLGLPPELHSAVLADIMRSEQLCLQFIRSAEGKDYHQQKRLARDLLHSLISIETDGIPPSEQTTRLLCMIQLSCVLQKQEPMTEPELDYLSSLAPEELEENAADCLMAVARNVAAPFLARQLGITWPKGAPDYSAAPMRETFSDELFTFLILLFMSISFYIAVWLFLSEAFAFIIPSLITLSCDGLSKAVIHEILTEPYFIYPVSEILGWLRISAQSAGCALLVAGVYGLFRFFADLSDSPFDDRAHLKKYYDCAEINSDDTLTHSRPVVLSE